MWTISAPRTAATAAGMLALAFALCGCGGGGDPDPELELGIDTRALTAGRVGDELERVFQTSGGTPPYQWQIADGTLPPGLALSLDGVLAGVPTAVGGFRVTISVVDARGRNASRTFTISIVAAGEARQFHVSPDGDDAMCGAVGQQWRTIQHAADTALPSDVVTVHAGTYDEDVILTRSAADAAPITFTAASGEAVTVRSFELAQGVSHIRLSGFAISGYSVWGVTLSGDNEDVHLTHLDISGGDAGMRFTIGNSADDPWYGPVSDVLVEDTVIRDPLYAGVDGTPGPCDQLVFRRVEVYGAGLGEASWAADGIAIEKGEDILVEDCHLYDNGGDGIDLNSRDFEGNVPGIVVRGNVVARNRRTGIKLWAGGRVERNAVWGQGVNPLSVGVFDSEFELINNTIAYNMWSSEYGARDYAGTVGYPESAPPPQVRLTMRNNIWAFNTGPAQGSPTGLYLGPGVQLVDERNNLFFSREDEEIAAAFLGDGVGFSRAEIAAGTWAAATGHGFGDLTVAPLFVSGWPNVDLHLQPGSPAVGLGAY